MATRKPSQSRTQAPTTSPEVVADTTQENTVSTDTIETPVEDVETSTTETEAPVPGEATTETPAEPAAEVDLSGFQSAVDSAVEDSDGSTGDIAEAPLAAVTKAYRELPDLKSKNAARKLVTEAMKSAMDEMNLPRARAFLSIEKKALVAASGGGSTRTSTPRPPADPTEAFVQRIGGLRLALNLAVADIPEGVGEDWADRAKALVAEHEEAGKALLAYTTTEPAEGEEKGEAPEAEAWVQGAVKLALGKAGKVGTSARAASTGGGATFDGPRRSIAAHIANAFADVEPGGFLTIAQIKAKPSEEYGSDSPSAGAVSARLFPASGKYNATGLDGIEPATDANGKKGARKVA